MPDRSLTCSRGGDPPVPAQPACFHRLDEILGALRSMTSTHLDRSLGPESVPLAHLLDLYVKRPHRLSWKCPVPSVRSDPVIVVISSDCAGPTSVLGQKRRNAVCQLLHDRQSRRSPNENREFSGALLDCFLRHRSGVWSDRSPVHGSDRGGKSDRLRRRRRISNGSNAARSPKCGSSPGRQPLHRRHGQ